MASTETRSADQEGSRPPKRKVTVTLDRKLVAELEQFGNISAQLNEAGWDLVDKRDSQARLTALLDRLDAEDGPLPDDPEEDARIERLLRGTT